MNDVNQLLEQLKKLPFISPRFCDSCGFKHMEDDFRFIGNQDGNFMFQIVCKSCRSSYLLKINPSASGLAAQRMELNADLSPEEFKKFAGKPQIEKDEALEVYTDMREVNNIDDFLKLLSKRNSDIDAVL